MNSIGVMLITSTTQAGEVMTPKQQKRRAVLQAREIKKYAKKEKLSIANGFDKWITSNNAQIWAQYYDGEMK
jgi:hypothetical protein